MQFATNVLGYFWLIDAFTAILKASAPARVVNVASYWAGGLDLNDLQFTRRRYDNDQAYRQSKQADRMLSVAFCERLKPYHIAVNACHPGDVNSTLSHDLGFGGHETPDQGAEPPMWLATHPIGQQNTGRYYEHRRESNCIYGRDRQAVSALYERCANYSSAKDPAGNNFPNVIVTNSRLFTPLFEKEGAGEIYQTNPPRSPFFKGGSYF